MDQLEFRLLGPFEVSSGVAPATSAAAWCRRRHVADPARGLHLVQ